jgi:endonuclease III
MFERNGLKELASTTRAELARNINNVDWLKNKAKNVQRIQKHFEL